jgi:hypothetical protein
MREICTSGSVGGEGGNILAYPAQRRTPNNGWYRHALGRVRRAHAVGSIERADSVGTARRRAFAHPTFATFAPASAR